MTMGELWYCLGLCLTISLYPGFPYHEFSLKERIIYWNLPYLGTNMSSYRFEMIHKCHHFREYVPPRHQDQFCWVSSLIDSWNKNMSSAFALLGLSVWMRSWLSYIIQMLQDGWRLKESHTLWETNTTPLPVLK